MNPLTPSALTLTGFQDQRLTVRPTLRCYDHNVWRRRRDSNADSLFGIGRLAPCWFNQFTHVSVKFWCHWRELNPQTLVSKTSGYANSPTVAEIKPQGLKSLCANSIFDLFDHNILSFIKVVIATYRP